MPVTRKPTAAPRARKKGPAAARRGKPATGRDRAVKGPRATAKKPASARESAEPMSQLLRSLRQITDELHYAHRSFVDGQLKLPQPEDFEPLLAPLREFARVSPALVEAFRGVIQTTRALVAPPAPGTAEPNALPGIDAGRIGEARRYIDAARETLGQALGDLPRDADYRRVAAQLRELASVSPSLLDWLKEVPALATPLSRSLAALRRAASDLETARDLLTEDVAAPAPTPTPR